MQILMYIHGLSAGGAERVFALLASGFVAEGHDVTLAVDYEAPENGAFLDPRVRLAVVGPSHATSVRGLARLLRSGRFDVSLSAVGSSNLKHTVAAVLAGRARRAVLSCHGYFDAEPQRLSRLGNALTPLTSRLTGATVCVSEGLRRSLEEHAHAAASRLVAITNPVRLAPASFQPPRSLAQRPPLVLGVGRLSEVKRFDLLLRAFAGLRNRQATLTILGEGAERNALERLAAELGVSGRVTFTGHVPDPSPYYEAAKVLAVSSRSESFGNAVVEALSYGLPVVATRCGGPQEILTDASLGELVPVGDAEGLAAAIDRALDEPGDPAVRMSHAAQYAPQRCVRAYLALFERLARGEGARAG